MKPLNITETVEQTLEAATAYVRSVCRDRLPADEQLSIAGMVLMKTVESYDPVKGDFITYAKPALRGAVNQAWRDREPVVYGSEIPERTEESEYDQEMEDTLLGAADPDWTGIDARERFELLRPFLKRLEEHELRVLILHYNANFSFSLIAEMCRVSRAAVHRTHSLSLRKLRHQLMDSGKYKILAAQ
jgi:RNA polymerase sigma factor (sigma-70 family)